MELLEIADWALLFMRVFGLMCLAYAAAEVLVWWLDKRKINQRRLIQLETYSQKAYEENQAMRDLVEWARSRELELTEERDRLRKRNVLMARELTLEDLQSKRTTVWNKE